MEETNVGHMQSLLEEKDFVSLAASYGFENITCNFISQINWKASFLPRLTSALCP